MLIDSKFHDYYDTILSFGIDKTCIYRRTTENVELKDKRRKEIYQNFPQNTKTLTTEIKPFLIGFCGKIYLGLKETCTKIGYSEVFIYDYDKVLNYFENQNGFWWRRNKSHIKDLCVLCEKLFQELNVPVFLIERNSLNSLVLFKNPNLKSFSFQKAVPPAQAFQEIYQYLAGVLGNIEKETVKVSDKVKLQQKGFDKNSFKTMKGDKKPRKQNRNKTK
jgi:hypothetical protein